MDKLRADQLSLAALQDLYRINVSFKSQKDLAREKFFLLNVLMEPRAECLLTQRIQTCWRMEKNKSFYNSRIFKRYARGVF